MKTLKPVAERSKNEVDKYAAKQCKQHQVGLFGTSTYCPKKGHQRKLTKLEVEWNYTPEELERLAELQKPADDKAKSEPAFTEASKEEVVESEKKEVFQVIRIDSDDYKTDHGIDWKAVTREIVAHISKANSKGFNVEATGYGKGGQVQNSTPHHVLIEEKE